MGEGYDAHAHLDHPSVADLDAVLLRSRAAGVTGWCLAASDPARWQHLLATASRIGAQVALGVHPWFAHADPGPALRALDALPTPDAFGEIGLDRLTPGFDDQQPAVARAVLARARAFDRPVVLHCVRAHAELLAMLRHDGLPRRGGLIHAWTADAPALTPFLALGLHISFGPHLLRSGRALRAGVAMPADLLLLESDAPFGASEPARIAEHTRALAAARGDDPTALLERCGANARRLLAVA